MSRLLAVAWFPGAVRAVLPVVRELGRRGWKTHVLTGPQGAQVARRFAPDVNADILFEPAAAGAAVTRELDVVLAGVSEGDSAEKYAVAAARAQGISTCAVLDTWIDSADRMTSAFSSDAALPDAVAVVNARARAELEASDVFRGRAVVTGQPGLDEFLAEDLIDRPDEDSRLQYDARKVLGFRPAGELVAFLTQPIEQQWGDALGYTQYDALAVVRREVPPDALVVALHPRDDREKVVSVVSDAVTVVADYDPHALYRAADIVASCYSAGLIEAVLVGRPALSVQPSLGAPDPCWMNAVGATIPVYSANELSQRLDEARIVRRTPDALRARRRRIDVAPCATERVCALVERLARSRHS